VVTLNPFLLVRRNAHIVRAPAVRVQAPVRARPNRDAQSARWVQSVVDVVGVAGALGLLRIDEHDLDDALWSGEAVGHRIGELGPLCRALLLDREVAPSALLREVVALAQAARRARLDGCATSTRGWS